MNCWARLLVALALAPCRALADASSYGTLDCSPSHAVLNLKSEKKLVEAGLEPESVDIPRQLCHLKFPPQSCTSHDPDVAMPSAEAIAKVAAPQPLVLIVKMGVGSPFAGDRAQILTSVVADAAAHGGLQVVMLVDRSQWTKSGNYKEAHEALPAAFAPLVVGYSIADIQRHFPTKTLVPRSEPPFGARARAIGKYYETYSWSWWWLMHGKAAAAVGKTTRVWTIEDDTVFTGSWARLTAVLERGLAPLDARGSAKGGDHAGADLVSFRDYCTPEKSWIWARYMHEGVANLTTPGRGLETWMTAYGLSPRFLDAVVASQTKGDTGHIEWFPPTLALREGFGLVFVAHDLRGQSLGRSCSGGGERRGGTFNYCCQGKNTVDSENWCEI